MKVPVTPGEIRALLEARGLAPIHRLGQNFLARPETLDRIVAAAEPLAGRLVLEVGPGLGGLTARLRTAGARVLAVEIDAGLAAWLEEVFAEDADFRLVHGDVLGRRKGELNGEVLEALAAWGAFAPEGEGFLVVANLPYQISSPFLAALPVLPRPPERVVVMLQEEVGDVLRARPKDADYSPLSFLAALAYEVERLFVVGRRSFFPPPRVESSVSRLVARPRDPAELARALPLARRLFQGRRKALRGTVRRAMRELEGSDPGPEAVDRALRAAGLEGQERVDGVDPERILALAETLRRAAEEREDGAKGNRSEGPDSGVG